VTLLLKNMCHLDQKTSFLKNISVFILIEKECL
jgi:hypothetical protein